MHVRRHLEIFSNERKERMNEHRCFDNVLDEMFYDRLTGTKFSSNKRPTNVQHEDQMLDEMLDTFDLSLRPEFLSFG